MNVENGAKVSIVLWNESYFITLMKRLFVTCNKYAQKVETSYA